MLKTGGPDSAESVLAKSELFSSLSPLEIEGLVSRSTLCRFADGQVLFTEGEPCQGMYVLAKGSARIFKSSSAGREILLMLQRAPATIAEVPVFDGGPYPASAQAVGELEAYLISKADFEELCRRHPDVGLKVLATVGRRMRALVGIVHQVTFGNVRQRLANMLLEQERQQGDSPFTLSETHQELAMALGSVREVVSRNLSRFQAQGLIRSENRRVWILDQEGLEREADTELA